MARIVKRTFQDPYKLTIGGEDKNKLYWYDAAGQRHECADSFPNIRSFRTSAGAIYKPWSRSRRSRRPQSWRLAVAAANG